MGSLVVDAKALVEEFKLLRNSFLHVAFGPFLELIVAVTEMAELAPARSWVLEEILETGKQCKTHRYVFPKRRSGHLNRPSRVWHCFEGKERDFWSKKARLSLMSWKISTERVSSEGIVGTLECEDVGICERFN